MSVAEIARFVKEMDSGDLVVAANGSTILGELGRVELNSDYRYEPTETSRTVARSRGSTPSPRVCLNKRP